MSDLPELNEAGEKLMMQPYPVQLTLPDGFTILASVDALIRRLGYDGEIDIHVKLPLDWADDPQVRNTVAARNQLQEQMMVVMRAIHAAVDMDYPY